MSSKRCSAEWFDGSPQSIAQRLLGCVLVCQSSGCRCSGVIVEVEAYLGKSDPASHSASGPSRKNATMFEPAGHLYVYSIHSRHCLNVVTQPAGIGSAVLIRALEPIEGIDTMLRNRRLSRSMREKTRLALLRHLTSGPGRLCEAIGVDRRYDGLDLATSNQVWIESRPEMVATCRWKIAIGRRIGIRKGSNLRLRWFLDGHQFVSGKAADHTAGRSWRFSPR